MSSNALYGAVALFSAMAMALCGVGLMDSSEAAYDETSDIYELELAPGFSYTWTPTYPSDLDVTTTVEKYEAFSNPRTAEISDMFICDVRIISMARSMRMCAM